MDALAVLPAPTTRPAEEPADPASVWCPSVTGSPLGVHEAQQLSDMLKVLADPARLRLLSLIAAHENGEACVCDLIDPVGLTQPTVSHHLKVLMSHGLLIREKRGVYVYYRFAPAQLTSLAQALTPGRLVS